MLKRELVELIVDKFDKVDKVEIIKVYGVSCGVGYDLRVDFTNEIGLKAHANRHSWALPSYLREDQDVFKKYTGRNDVYRESVKSYWTENTKDALREYFGRYKKEELFEGLNKIDIILGGGE